MKKFLLASAIAAASTTAAHAVPLTFTYTTQAGVYTEGVLDGTASATPGVYTNITVLSARMFDPLGMIVFDSNIQGIDASGDWWAPSMASIDGSQVEFYFCFNGCVDGLGLSASNDFVLNIYNSGSARIEETFVVANWTLGASLPAVPAPASLPLAAAGIGALALLRRRKKAA